jgi:plastocyanin
MKQIGNGTAGGRYATVTLSLMVILAAGCKPSDAIRQAPIVGNGSRRADNPLDPATLGTLSGTIDFVGKPPARLKLDMSQDPGCMKSAQNSYAEQFVVHEGRLANVYVYIKQGPPAALAAPLTNQQPVIVDQVGCVYVPHVVALMRGGTVDFRNSDPTMHNIHTAPGSDGRSLNLTQTRKAQVDRVLFKQSATMMAVRCDLHPWMIGYINVSETPFFAVTDTEGHFEIDDLPAGTYVIAAVHEKMGEQTMTINIKPHQTGKADFSFATK